jgi:exportin-T
VRGSCFLLLICCAKIVYQSGIHNQDTSVRSRVFYLFHRFVKEVKNDLPIGIVVNVLEGIRDLLQIEVEIPEMEGDATQTELLAEAAEKPGIFDPQLYLYETVGILASLLGKNPEQQASVLLSVVEPLLEDLSVCLETAAKGSPEVTTILRVHHIIMALGNIAKGFPEHPAAASESYVQPAPEVFARVAQAILVSLERMNVFKVVRDAVRVGIAPSRRFLISLRFQARFAFARILATAGAKVTQFIPPLMVSLLVHFEPAELADFMGFIALLIHKLQVRFMCPLVRHI